MSILSTDKKLISFGTDYSAGSGISIIDHTISIVPSAVGKVYSAGPNIGIYDVSGQPTISSKDWTQDIDQSSSGAVTESIDYFNTWINGQYTEDISNVTNNLTALSGDLSSYYKKTETSSKVEISAALDYVSAHAVGDVEVNNYVHNNSATIDEVNSSYQSNSANYLTAVNIPESAIWNETSNVVSSNSASWSEGKTYTGISPVVVNNNENKISADTWVLSAGDGISFTDDSANKVTRIDVTAQGGGSEVQNLVRSNSSTWDSVTNKLDTTAFSTVSGTFLTAVNIPESATWNDASTTVQTNSAQWGQGGGGSVSSKYGTITVDGSDIEATNKAIEFKSYGFTSSFNATLSEYIPTATFTWDNYSEGTTLTIVSVVNHGDSDGLTYSSNTNVTGLITAYQWRPTDVSLSLPNATAIQFSANHNYNLNGILVTAASSFQVKELAWKNDLPTYTYNSNNKISAINGSALAGVEVSHDSSLSGNGTVNSPLGAVPGYNETVLFSASAGTSAATLSESFENFESIKLVHNTQVEEFWKPKSRDAVRYWHTYGSMSQGVYKMAMVHLSMPDTTHITNTSAKSFIYALTGTGTTPNSVSVNDTYALNTIYAVIGINRIAGSN